MIKADLLELYNNLINVKVDLPVGVMYSKPNRCVVFTQYSWRMDVSMLNYYCSDLVKIKRTILLPEDLRKLLDNLKLLINSPMITKDKVLVSPTKYGFNVYRTNPNNLSLGPIKLGEIKLISSNNWLFRKIVNIRYKDIIGDITR